MSSRICSVSIPNNGPLLYNGSFKKEDHSNAELHEGVIGSNLNHSYDLMPFSYAKKIQIVVSVACALSINSVFRGRGQ